jgi:plastocyanin
MTMRRMDARTSGARFAAIAALALLSACGESESRNRKAIREGGSGGGGGTAGAALKKVDPATAGTISGVVKFEGTPPTRDPIDMSANKECMAHAKDGPVLKEDVVVNDGKVQYAFLFLDIKDDYEVPTEPVVLDQIGCHYVPHVLGVQAGQTVHVKSSDETSHNVHFIGKPDANGEDNFGMPKPMVKVKTFVAEVGMLKFKCDVHPWMGAWMGVKTHPFFATSAADGTYMIKNVPPGEYDLVLHHEKLGDQRMKVKVETGKATTQDFTLKLQ